MEAELVTTLPSMGSVYAKALRTLGRKGHDPVLPQTVLVYRGAVAQREQLARYRHTVDAPVNGVLPSLYVHSLAFPLAMSLMLREDFPLPLLGMIHLGNEVSVQRSLADDEAFDIEVHSENLAAHHRGATCDLIVRIVVAGEQRLQLRSTFLAKGVKLDGPAPKASRHPVFTPPPHTASWTLDAATGRTWASVAGDYNPIHLSALSARALGMPRAIAHGIYLAARALAGIEPSVGSYQWQVEFQTPVLLPARVNLAFNREPDGYAVQAWDARKGKPHFALTLRQD